MNEERSFWAAECLPDRIKSMLGFEPIVVRVRTVKEPGELSRTIYVVDVRMTNGKTLGEKEVPSLENIPYFDLWGVPDALITGETRKLLEYKLQKESMQVDRECVHICEQGCHEDDNGVFLILGNRVLSKAPLNSVIRIKEPLNMKASDMRLVLLAEASKIFIRLLPGVTEMLFYGVMLAVLRPFLYYFGFKPDFLIALIGPSGHLKTTLAEKYALWLKNHSEQEATFKDYGRFDDVLKRIDKLVGQNFLADDLHAASSRNGYERQNEKLDVLCRHVSGVKQCAQIILTGERLDDMGIFSCRDRILQIKVPKMESNELAETKRMLNRIQFDYIPGLAMKFAEALVNNQEMLRNDIEDFFQQVSSENTEQDYSLRIPQHANYLKLTEMLYRKYLLNSSTEDSCKELFYEAIDKNYAIQRAELLQTRNDEECDVVVEILNMLNGGILMCIDDIRCYRPNNMEVPSYLLHDGKICITKNILQTGMNRHLGKTCSAKQLSDAMHDAGILEEDMDSRTKKICTHRHYVINYYLLKQYCEGKQEHSF